MAQRVESEYVGVACGIMDQFASALSRRAHALHIWCDTGDTEDVAMRDVVLIFDTAVPRSLRGSDFNVRRAECERALELLRSVDPSLPHLAAATPALLAEARLPAPLDRRARHVVEETARVRRTVDALRGTGTLPGDLMYQSHESLRSLYECSTAELDWFVERASRVEGVRGARLTGAGWGGCAIAVGDEGALHDASRAIGEEYRSRFGITPRVWLTRAEDGARVERDAR
jgi:galactokinase